MERFIEVTIKYDKRHEDGVVRRVSEKYMTDALSLTEAEALVTEHVRSYVSEELVATLAKRTKIAEICGIGADKYWLAKVAFVTIDEKTSKEKRSVLQMLVGADNFKEAYDVFVENMKGTVSDWELLSLSETKIAEVIKCAIS